MKNHEDIWEEILPIPEGYKLLKIENNEMTLIKIEDYLKIIEKLKRERKEDVWLLHEEEKVRKKIKALFPLKV